MAFIRTFYRRLPGLKLAAVLSMGTASALASTSPNLKDTVAIANVWNVHFSSFDERVYFYRSGSSGATYRLESNNTSTLLYSGSAKED